MQLLGVEEFSKVAIISNNRWEWAAIAAKIDSVAVEHADAPVPTPPRKKTVKKT